MTPIKLATLRFVAERTRIAGRIQTVDIRAISEPMRQKIIDLGMMDPPLVKIDADQVSITGYGDQYLRDHYRQRERTHELQH